MHDFITFVRYAHLEMSTAVVIAFVLSMTVCLLFRASRFGLILAYLFALRMGGNFMSEYFGPEYFPYLFIYSMLGLAVFFIGLYLAWTSE
ncbi:hypothetical protein [Kiritimatiella glycovorans]|uniref:Uncharacterized protein n=1 Tax=Kiritimatiella glycovorans TaxID=1307763 RepID=A0A0G3EMX8_9BACT|nr:hypothetical protein [Kiritimatiella glycovorans]AKJ65484.1 hypothetical protein L21SP4_02257 [Kiritimatiella glycovorans]